MEHKLCAICDKMFVPRRKSARYCSLKCVGKSQRKPQQYGTCRNCGIQFPITQQQAQTPGWGEYCSQSCHLTIRNVEVAIEARPEPITNGEVVLIPLSQGKWAKVDKADYDTLPMLREPWTFMVANGLEYAYRANGGYTKTLHRFLMKPPKGMVVHHRSSDGLDNRRENLVVCTQSQNLQARRKSITINGKPPSSKYKGVSKDRNGKWLVRLGCFDSEIEAARAYNKAALANYGEFAVLNDVD